MRRAGVISVLCALVAAAAASRADAGLVVGFADDGPKLEGEAAVEPARQLGARALRITLLWHPDQSELAPGAATELLRAVTAASGLRVVLAVYGPAATPPLDAVARERYCAYVRDALLRVPTIDDVVIWNEPNLSTFWRPQFAADGTSLAPAAYQALLARCWDVLHAARPGIRVIGPATSPRGTDRHDLEANVSHSPGTFIRKVGEAYRASARALPIFDVVGHNVYGDSSDERPWQQHIGTKTIAQGDWNKLMWNLATAFSGTGQPIPGECREGRCVSIFYLEAGFETQIDPAKQPLYVGNEVARSVPDRTDSGVGAASVTEAAPDQSTQIVDAVRLAACQPYVEAFFNFLVWDERDLGRWQSAPFWVDRTPKDSASAFAQAFDEANRGAVDCAQLKGGRPSADYVPPPAPTELEARLERNSLRVELAWTGSLDPSGIAGYRIYRDGAFHALTTETVFADYYVQSWTGYRYAVYAQDRAGNLSAVSNEVAVEVDDGAAPTAPEPLLARLARNPSRVFLKWGPSTDDAGVTEYVVRRDGFELARTRARTFVDRSPRGPAWVQYDVSAADAAGNLSAPAALTLEMSDVIAPSPPRRLRAELQRGRRAIALEWRPSRDNVRVARYRIYRNGRIRGIARRTRFVDRVERSLLRYTYSVLAVDTAGNRGARSRKVSVQVPASPAPRARRGERRRGRAVGRVSRGA